MNPQADRFAASKCNVHSCKFAVAGISRHAFCNRHRPCNSEGYYDPEKCDVCMSMYSKANSDGCVGSKSLIAGLYRAMCRSSSFYYPIIWANPDFKTLYHDPLELSKLRSRSSAPAAARRPPAAHPRGSSVSNSASHFNPNSHGADAPRSPDRPSRVSSKLSRPSENPRSSFVDPSGRPTPSSDNQRRCNELPDIRAMIQNVLQEMCDFRGLAGPTVANPPPIRYPPLAVPRPFPIRYPALVVPRPFPLVPSISPYPRLAGPRAFPSLIHLFPVLAVPNHVMIFLILAS